VANYEQDMALVAVLPGKVDTRAMAEAVKEMLLAGITVKGSRVGVLGLTFKEDCADLRNSRVVDIIQELQSYQTDTHVHDPMASKHEAKHEYGIELCEWDDLQDLDAIIIATAHRQYKSMTPSAFKEKLKPHGLVFDVKGILDRGQCADIQLPLWRL